MNKIIITGATSMLGTALTEVAIREGVDVYAVVRPNTSRMDRLLFSPLVHPIYGTLEELDKITDIPTDCDALYHFAWLGTKKNERDDPWIQDRNIRHIFDAVELAQRCGCQRFIGAGSQAEYGPVYDVIDENTKFAPIIAYGIAKYAAGILSRKLCEQKGMEHIWGRVFSVYGPHDNKGTMLESAIKTWEKGDSAHFSSGVQMWNYLYESDAGEMFYRLGKPSIPNGAYLIANSESRTLRSYIDDLIDAYGEKVKAEFDAETSAPVPGLNVDAKRTFNAIEYTPQVTFQAGINTMVSAIKGKDGRP